MAKKMVWVCSACGRVFKNKPESHLGDPINSDELCLGELEYTDIRCSLFTISSEEDAPTKIR